MNLKYFLFLIPLIFLIPLEADAFPLDPLNSDPRALVLNENNYRLSILDGEDNKSYGYTPSGVRLPTLDFPITTGTNSTGMMFKSGYYYIVDGSTNMVSVYTSAGIRYPSKDFSTNESTGNQDIIDSGRGYFYVLNSNLNTIQAYNAVSSTGHPYVQSRSHTITTDDITKIYSGVRIDGERMFILASPFNMIYGYDPYPITYDPTYNLFTNSLLPNIDLAFLFYLPDDLWVLNSTHVTRILSEPVLQDITTLSASSTTPFTIDLEWESPRSVPPVIGYQINYSSPFTKTANDIIINFTANTASSVKISNLSVGQEYSLAIAPYTSAGKGNPSNTVNSTTLHTLEIGNIEISEDNPEKVDIRFSSNATQVGNTEQTAVIVVFDKNWNLECRYATKLNVTGTIAPTIIIPFDSTHNQARMIFSNASNDIVTIRCTDLLTNQYGDYLLTQFNFPLKQQIEDFRSGTYGTVGMVGALDIVTLCIILLSMIGFNSKNESVGLVGSIAVIGIALFFELITYPTVLLPLVAFVIMLVFASTKKS